MSPHLRPALWLSVALLIIHGTSAANPSAEVVKSRNDDRSYRHLTLDNQLQVLLISDPDTDEAAAALDVAVGSYADPDDRPGLAHFLEHMLFLGTEKYPESDDYHGFISRHGGRHNAYTAAEHTNYFFSVDEDQLQPALDRFGQFFIGPLFDNDYLAREMNAVDAEYRSKLNSDGWRLFSVRKALANPEHPYARFTVGNLATLADRPQAPIRQAVMDFYRQHYSANRMALTVLGQEPLDQLQAWVEAIFSAVPNYDFAPLRYDSDFYRTEDLPRLVTVAPVQEQRQLNLIFPIPAVEPHYRSKPTTYIANLLGHEGEGSLLSILKAQGLAEGLSAGVGTSDRDRATFEVSIQLTPAGVEAVDTILRGVFAYLDLIRRDGIDAWRFAEQRQLATIAFQFQEPFTPVRYVSALANRLHSYPAADILRGPYLMVDFDPDLIGRYLGALTPDNVLMTLMAPGVETDRRTPYFDAPYGVHSAENLLPGPTSDASPLGADLAGLALPAPNPFVPEDLTVATGGGDDASPERLVEIPGFTLWFQHDDTFDVPRANFYVSLRSPLATTSPKASATTQLYVEMVSDQLNEFAYPAQLAGLGFELYGHGRGLSLRVSGYDDQQDRLLGRLVAALADPELDSKRFERLKARFVRRLTNADRDPPQRQAGGEVVDLLIQSQWTEAQLLAALESLTLEDLAGHVQALLGGLDVVALAHGNLTAPEAKALGDIIVQGLLAGAKAEAVARPAVTRLEPRHYRRAIAVDHPDSAIAVYLQGRNQSVAERAKVALLAQVLRTPFFQTLRTEKQLGYIVYASPMPLLEVPGLMFAVQSPVVDPMGLEGHIDAFVADFEATFAAMTAEAFAAYRAGLISRLRQRDENLNERSNRFWREIDRENEAFDSQEQLAVAVEAISHEELLAFYRTFLLEEPRKLSIYAPGKAVELSADGGVEGSTTWIDDPAAFKNRQAIFSG